MNSEKRFFTQIFFVMSVVFFVASLALGWFGSMALIWISAGVASFSIFTGSIPLVNWNLAKTGLMTIFVLFGLFVLAIMAFGNVKYQDDTGQHG